jgi:esterase
MARLAAYRLGTGARGTVLLHGFLGSGRNLRPLAQRFSQGDPGRTVLVPDLRGHGASPALPDGATLATLARDVLETARLEGLTGPLSLVGHSLGGRVALAAAGLAPDQVRDLVLLDIAPGPLHGSRSDNRSVIDALLSAPAEAPTRRALRDHLLAAGLDQETADWLVMNARTEGDRCRWSLDRQALDQLGERTGAEDVWEVVERRAVPIRCVRGDRSECVSEEDAVRFGAAGCTVITLPGSHELHVDAPETLLAVLLAAS